eukprot:1526851-Prymnesium_polylepis.1
MSEALYGSHRGSCATGKIDERAAFSRMQEDGVRWRWSLQRMSQPTPLESRQQHRSTLVSSSSTTRTCRTVSKASSSIAHLLLLCLNDNTFLGEDGEAVAQEVQRMRAHGVERWSSFTRMIALWEDAPSEGTLPRGSSPTVCAMSAAPSCAFQVPFQYPGRSGERGTVQEDCGAVPPTAASCDQHGAARRGARGHQEKVPGGQIRPRGCPYPIYPDANLRCNADVTDQHSLQ